MLLFGASPARAQDDDSGTEPAITVVTDGDEAKPESEIVRDDETSDTIQGIRRNLIVVAIVTAAALVLYLWHTSPSRRFRIAAARVRADRRVEDAAED